MKLLRKIYESLKLILAFAVLICEFYIIWDKGYYTLFFSLLILFPTIVFFRDNLIKIFVDKTSYYYQKKYLK